MIKAHRNWPMFVLVVLVLSASAVALGESYHGIRNWALGHGVQPGLAADAWPLQVDLFIVAGDLGLALSAFYAWPYRVRVLSWWSVGIGLAASITTNGFQDSWMGNPIAHHLTAAVPPISATAGLMICLSVTKQYAAGWSRSLAESANDVQWPQAHVPENDVTQDMPSVTPIRPVPAYVPESDQVSEPDGTDWRRLHVVPPRTGTSTAQADRWRARPEYSRGLEVCREYQARGEALSLAVLAAAIGQKNKSLATFIKREFQAGQVNGAVHE